MESPGKIEQSSISAISTTTQVPGKLTSLPNDYSKPEDTEKTANSTELPLDDQLDENNTQYQANYLNGSRLYILPAGFAMTGIMLSIDGSILSTAIPRITTDFNSIDDIGWYASAYLLAEMCLQPTFGRVYSYFEAKAMFLFSLLLFEIGSVICAVAPSSLILILGRAIAGAAAAGMLSSE